MSTLKKLSDTVKGLLSRKDTQLPGFLGNLSGAVKADDANNVYVTLFGGEVRVVYNGKVPNVPRLPVLIGYAPNSNQLEILGARDVFTKPPYPEVPPHAMLHTFPGADTIPIRGEQFLPGLITPAGGLTVKVYGVAYQIAGIWYVLTTQTVDLTAEVPASGALMALLQVDNTGTINITAGTAVDSRSELGFDDIPAGDADQYTLGAVKLYNGQDRILFTVTDTDIVDLRWGRGAVDIAAIIHAATEDTSPLPDDEFGIWESVSGLLRKVKWSSIITTLGASFVRHSASTASQDFLVGSGTGAWIKKTFAETISILRTSLDSAYAALTHTHAASDVTSGTLDVARLPIPVTDFISGLKINYVSTTSISVGIGAAYVDGDILTVSSAISVTSISAIDDIYHVYLYDNSGTPAIELSTTDPASAAYFGTARTKNGDTTRRYLGSVLCTSVGGVQNFAHISNSGYMSYTNVAVPKRILSGGTATTKTTVSAAGATPPTATAIQILAINTTNVNLFVVDTSDVNFLVIPTLLRAAATAPLDGVNVYYKLASAPSSGSAFIDVLGYYFER